MLCVGNSLASNEALARRRMGNLSTQWVPFFYGLGEALGAFACVRVVLMLGLSFDWSYDCFNKLI